MLLNSVQMGSGVYCRKGRYVISHFIDLSIALSSFRIVNQIQIIFDMTAIF